jgi:hypothetical protein
MVALQRLLEPYGICEVCVLFIWPRLLLYYVVMNRHSFQRLVLKQNPTTLIMSIKALCTTLHVFNNTVPNTQRHFLAAN